jgi:hypothetical protein
LEWEDIFKIGGTERRAGMAFLGWSIRRRERRGVM